MIVGIHALNFAFEMRLMKRFFINLLLAIIVPSAFAQDAKTPFQRVFDVISSPRAIDKSYQQILRDFGDLCKESTKSNAEQNKSGNVECVPDVGMEKFFIDGEQSGGIDKIDVKFHGSDKSAYAKSVLVKNFGAHPELRNGDLYWHPKKRKKSDSQSYVSFGATKDTSYFTFGNEADTGDGEG